MVDLTVLWLSEWHIVDTVNERVIKCICFTAGKLA